MMKGEHVRKIDELLDNPVFSQEFKNQVWYWISVVVKDAYKQGEEKGSKKETAPV